MSSLPEAESLERFQRETEKRKVDQAEAIQGIRRGLDSKAQGRGMSAAEAFESIRRRHGIDPDA